MYSRGGSERVEAQIKDLTEKREKKKIEVRIAPFVTIEGREGCYADQVFVVSALRWWCARSWHCRREHSKKRQELEVQRHLLSRLRLNFFFALSTPRVLRMIV